MRRSIPRRLTVLPFSSSEGASFLRHGIAAGGVSVMSRPAVQTGRRHEECALPRHVPQRLVSGLYGTSRLTDITNEHTLTDLRREERRKRMNELLRESSRNSLSGCVRTPLSGQASQLQDSLLPAITRHREQRRLALLQNPFKWQRIKSSADEFRERRMRQLSSGQLDDARTSAEVPTDVTTLTNAQQAAKSDQNAQDSKQLGNSLAGNGILTGALWVTGGSIMCYYILPLLS